MMMKSMSLGARRESQAIIKHKYHNASWTERSKLLDGFVAAETYPIPLTLWNTYSLKRYFSVALTDLKENQIRAGYDRDGF